MLLNKVKKIFHNISIPLKERIYLKTDKEKTEFNTLNHFYRRNSLYP